MADEPTQRFTHAVCLSNPSVRNNLGPVLRCCAAFASTEVMVVGYSKWNTHGAHGSNKVSLAFRCNTQAISQTIADVV
jgi:tRNA(Leu) C34 or U34 (ribose-2'-O)-methylase TrmL